MIVFSEKGIRIVAWLFSVMFFLVYMFNADRVYHALNGKSYAAKLPDDFSLYARGNLELQNFADHSPVNNKFKEGKGWWAKFASVANTSGNARVRVFLKSSDALYEVIENRQSFWVDSEKIVAGVFADTSALDNGTYTMGLYLIDDAGGKFAWMNSFFEKTDGGPVEYIAKPAALPPATASGDLNFALEEIVKEKKEIVLRGWVALNNAEMHDYNAYVTIMNSRNVVKAFYAPLFTRMDIASLYEDSRAANSGFQIRVPLGTFAPGKYVIKVIVKSRKTDDLIESEQSETRNF